MIGILFSVIGSPAPALANHLWQSTAFAGGIGLLVLLFRKNRARVRYGLWLAASLKFLIPLSLLIGLGGVLPQRHSSGIPVHPAVSSAVDVISQPFTDWETVMPRASAQNSHERMLALLLPALFLAWFCGALIVVLVWCARWREARAMLRKSTPAEKGRELEILRRVEFRVGMRHGTQLCLSDDLMEPGIFGIFRPVLLWPRKLSERLEEEHFEGVLIHEVVHVRRRDNLTAALHMAVEAIFWFHPLVWWIERQLLNERERACDEAVVQFGSQARLYAESLLKVSRFCTEAPLQCVSGITGANLSTRVRAVMAPHFRELGLSRKILLSVLATLALVAPILFGQPQEPLRFEVAAIKPANPKLPANSWSSGGGPGGPFRMVNVPLKQWVEMGLSVKDYALKAPSWLDTSRFDLNARLPAGKPADQKAKAEMMKTLLIERFGLKWHEELQNVSGYELVTDKKVLIKPLSPLEQLKGHGSGSGPSSAQITNMPMSDFAEVLGKALGRPVVDATHLSGVFDIKLMWRPDNEAAIAQERQYGKQYGVDVDNLPSSADSALREQLGLRLQSAKVPSKIIVVDHMNSQPTAN